MSGQIFEVLDGRGRVVNRIVACAGFVQATYPGRWRLAAEPMSPAQPAPVPQAVTRAQGKAALIQAGLWPQVLAFVAALDDPDEKLLAETAINDTVNWERGSPFLRETAKKLGLTDEKLDALFVAAGGIEL